jgi:hypothetical protein
MTGDVGWRVEADVGGCQGDEMSLGLLHYGVSFVLPWLRRVKGPKTPKNGHTHRY